MANSLFPSYIVIEYHSAYGPHKMTIPTRQWSPGDETSPGGFFLTWDDTNKNATDMVEELVADFLPTIPDTVAFDSWTVYNYPSEEALPQPVYQAAFTDMVGSSVTPGWTKAAELVLTFHTTSFGIFKITLLDAATANNWDKLTALSTLTAVQPIIDDVTATGNAWAGRDNGRPLAFLQLSKNLNEKLRKAYRMQ